MRSLVLVPLLLAGVVAVGATAHAQESVGGTVIDIEATVLAIEATIVDIDAGTRTTQSSEQVAVALDADVFFAFDAFDLQPQATEVLDEVAAQIAASGVDAVAISGHTDDVGEDDYNQQLSEQRAQAVEDFLADRLEGVSLSSEGRGASAPVAPNQTADGDDNPEGRALNRRVEIVYND